MKKLTCAMMACLLLMGCGTGNESSTPAEVKDWTAQGYYQDENGYFLSITRMDDVTDPGWYVGLTLGEDMMADSYGGMLPQEGNALAGELPAAEDKEPLKVTLTEEGTDGIQVVVDGGETYHFTVMDLPDATIFVTINTEGLGMIDYAEGEEAPEINPEEPFQSSQINLGEPAVYTFVAAPEEGYHFVKWTKNGEDYSTEPVITLTLDETADFVAVFAGEIDYMALVNKLNPLPEGWENAVETVTITNSLGDEVEVEAKAYEAYLAMKEELETEDNVYTELDSARRSIAAQQDIMDSFTEKYGADYAAKTVAQPGYSEHHTGLALDLYFKIKNEDGTFTDVYLNEDMEKPEYKWIWDAIHARLADHGFILRYLEGEEHITGYRYEPWHIRYLNNVDAAKEIMAQPGLTLEEYLAGESAPEVNIDLSGSSLYTDDELFDAMLAVKCKFAALEDCKLKAIRYAGDAANNEENLTWLNSLDESTSYTQVMELLMDFETGEYGYETWDAGVKITDYPWWLGRNADNEWEIVTWGDQE